MSEPMQADEQSMSTNDKETSTTDDRLQSSSAPEPESGSEESGVSIRSIKSQAPQAIVENGRWYCNDTYFMPCDDAEQTRLAIFYQIYLVLLDNQISLGRIPPHAESILDLGTGTGDWAMAAAERSPNAEITAVDISAVLHPSAAPVNVSFELDDAQKAWTYNKPFDFIHMRDLAGAFSDWDYIYQEASKHLKLGGTLEVADQGRIQLSNEPPNSYTSIYNGALASAAEKAGTPLNLDHLKKSALEKAGLSVVKSKPFDLPIGEWDPNARKKLAGKMALIAILEGLEAAALRLLTKHQGWKEEDVKGLIGRVKEEILMPESRAYVRVQFVVARKIGV